MLMKIDWIVKRESKKSIISVEAIGRFLEPQVTGVFPPTSAGIEF